MPRSEIKLIMAALLRGLNVCLWFFCLHVRDDSFGQIYIFNTDDACAGFTRRTEPEQRGRVCEADPPTVQSAMTQHSREVKRRVTAWGINFNFQRDSVRASLQAKWEERSRPRPHRVLYVWIRTVPWRCLRRVVWQETYMVKLLSFGVAAAVAAAL